MLRQPLMRNRMNDSATRGNERDLADDYIIYISRYRGRAGRREEPNATITWHRLGWKWSRVPGA